MGKTLFFDCFAGISGDMTVAALLDAGVPLEYLEGELQKLPVSGWQLRSFMAQRGAFSARRFVVEPKLDELQLLPSSSTPLISRGHDHSGHDHGGHHHHGHDHGGHDHRGHHHGSHDHEDEFPGQPDRRWSTIRAMIQAAPLAPRVRSRALAAFEKLAIAEGRVHGIPPEEVAFHEVGAVDSILDLVGACVGLEWLDVERILCSPLPMGAGTTRSAHGLIPLPAPATLELLRGFPLIPSDFPGEHVTPTGAALLSALARPGPLPPLRLERIGYGAGKRDPSTHANVLRVLIGEGEAGAPGEVLELRAQVDDLSGEGMPLLLQALLTAGALDAFATPVLMKKGRPGYLITALCEETARAPVGEALLRHSGSFGYRYARLPREVLAREWQAVETPWGSVRMKLGYLGDTLLHAAPEFEDCRRVAEGSGQSWGAVHAAALGAWARRAG